jgi:hypothetical protein
MKILEKSPAFTSNGETGHRSPTTLSKLSFDYSFESSSPVEFILAKQDSNVSLRTLWQSNISVALQDKIIHIPTRKVRMNQLMDF